MSKNESKKIIREEIEPKLDEIKRELESVFDPDTIEEIMRVSRGMSVMTAEDCFRPFDI